MEPQVIFFDVFTEEVGKGNTVGIIYDPQDRIHPETYQQIAMNLGLSEVTVIIPDGEGTSYDYEFRFFAPAEEVALCGHGTIGAIAFLYLHQKCAMEKTNLRIKTGAGLIRGGIQNQTLYYMDQNLPIFYPDKINHDIVAKILGITPAHFKNHPISLPIQMVSTGRNKLIIPIRDLEILLAIRPNFKEMERFCHQIGTNGFHLFTLETIQGREGVHTRHFAPTAGVLEDPVTGNANGALGAYLVHYGVVDNGLENQIYIEQGHSLGRDGFLMVKIYKDELGLISRVSVGGKAVAKNL